MPVFTFYPYRADGLALTFETYFATSDDGAVLHAARVLADHDSASFVFVWDGDRPVQRVFRDPAGRDAKGFTDLPGGHPPL